MKKKRNSPGFIAVTHIQRSASRATFLKNREREGRKEEEKKKRIHMVLKVVVLNAQPGTDPFDELGPVFFFVFLR